MNQEPDEDGIKSKYKVKEKDVAVTFGQPLNLGSHLLEITFLSTQLLSLRNICI